MDVENTLDRALSEISNSNDLRSLDEVRVSFLGKKGELTTLLKSLGQMDPTERPKAGEAINRLNQQFRMPLSIARQVWLVVNLKKN